MKHLSGIFFFLISINIGAQNHELALKELNDESLRYLSIDRTKACDLANKSFHLNATRFPFEEARNRLVLGICQKYEGNMDSAYSLLSLSKEYFENRGALSELALSYWYLGKVWYDLNQYDRAKPMYVESAKIYNHIQDPEKEFKVINGLGTMEAIQGNYDVALTCFLKSLEIAKKNDYSDMYDRLYNNVSNVYSRMDEYDKALDFNLFAMIMAKSSSNWGVLIEAYYNRSRLFRKSGLRDSAQYYLEASVHLSKGKGVENSKTYYILSQFYRDAKEYNRSNAYLYKNLNSNVAKMAYRSMWALTNNYMAMNYLDSALFFGIESYKHALSTNSRSNAFKSAKTVADIYSLMGNHKKANEYLEAYIMNRDSVFNEEREKNITNKRIQIETLDKANEIERLKIQAQIDELNRLSIIRTGSAVGLLIFSTSILIVVWYRNKMKLERFRELEMINEIDRNKKELHAQTLHMIRLNNTIQDVEDRLISLQNSSKKGSEIRSILSTIRVNKSLEKEWENFNQYFKNIHPGFVDNIKREYSELTINEVRLCALLKMNLKNSEIASLLNIEQKSATMSKYRLKKKFGLTEEMELDDFIHQLQFETA